MIEETGRVLALDENPQRVWVETRRQSACQSCAARNGCGHSLMNRWGARQQHIQALSRLPLKVGDYVVVSIPEDVVLKGAMLAYLMPLLLMMLATGLASYLEWAELWLGLSALAGLLLGLLLLAWQSRRLQRDARYQPEVLRRAEDPQTSVCRLESR